MDEPTETSAAVLELQDTVMPVVADLLDRAGSRGWTKAQVLEAIGFAVRELGRPKGEDPDPADDPSVSAPAGGAPSHEVRMEEPANDWPAS